MNRVVVAFENDASRKKVCDMLESGGVDIRGLCRSGAEVIRKVREMGGGVVVCGYKLSDMNAANLAFNLHGTALVLVIASPEQLSYCEGSEVFQIPTPTSRANLTASVRMLEQLDEMQFRRTVPKRSSKEQAVINECKELLMEKFCMEEEETHKFLQHKSMDTGTRLAETAQIVLDELSK